MTIEEKIKSKGYMTILIRSKDYKQDRISKLTDLFSIIQRASVDIRGWDLPHIVDDRPRFGQNYIESFTDWSQYVEIWRFYQSGQFVHQSGYFLDWTDQSYFKGLIPPGWTNGTVIGLGYIVGRFTEVYELTSRLAQSPAGGSEMEIKINFKNLNNRQLINDNTQGMPLIRNYKASIDSYPHYAVITKEKLMMNARELALVGAYEFIQRFGMDPHKNLLQGIQQQISS
jgi:hypothetical protein